MTAPRFEVVHASTYVQKIEEKPESQANQYRESDNEAKGAVILHLSDQNIEGHEIHNLNENNGIGCLQNKPMVAARPNIAGASYTARIQTDQNELHIAAGTPVSYGVPNKTLEESSVSFGGRESRNRPSSHELLLLYLVIGTAVSFGWNALANSLSSIQKVLFPAQKSLPGTCAAVFNVAVMLGAIGMLRWGALRTKAVISGLIGAGVSALCFFSLTLSIYSMEESNNSTTEISHPAESIAIVALATVAGALGVFASAALTGAFAFAAVSQHAAAASSGASIGMGLSGLVSFLAWFFLSRVFFNAEHIPGLIRALKCFSLVQIAITSAALYCALRAMSHPLLTRLSFLRWGGRRSMGAWSTDGDAQNHSGEDTEFFQVQLATTLKRPPPTIHLGKEKGSLRGTAATRASDNVLYSEVTKNNATTSSMWTHSPQISSAGQSSSPEDHQEESSFLWTSKKGNNKGSHPLYGHHASHATFLAYEEEIELSRTCGENSTAGALKARSCTALDSSHFFSNNAEKTSDVSPKGGAGMLNSIPTVSTSITPNLPPTSNATSRKTASDDDAEREIHSEQPAATHESEHESAHWKAVLTAAHVDVTALFLTMMISFFFYPTVWPFSWRENPGSLNDRLVGVFQAGDFCGRFLPLYLPKIPRKGIATLSYGRFLFLLLGFFVQKTPFLRTNGFCAALIIGSLAISNGVIATLAAVDACMCVKSEEAKSKVSSLALVALLSGVAAGSALSTINPLTT